MGIDLRCKSRKRHGIIMDADILEVKCDSRFCGAGKGAVVLHRFNKHTGELVSTNRYREPHKGTGGTA